MAIRWRCVKCKIDLRGEGAFRHYLVFHAHRLEKLPPLPKPVIGERELAT